MDIIMMLSIFMMWLLVLDVKSVSDKWEYNSITDKWECKEI